MTSFGTEKLVHTIDEFKAVLTDFSKVGPKHALCVGVDIGATNTRINILEPHKKVVLMITSKEIKKVSALLDYLREADAAASSVFKNVQDVTVTSAIAVAGPILELGKSVKFTNFDAADAFLSRDQLPSFLFPKNATRFLNDLEAACHGIVAERGTLDRYFSFLWKGKNDESAKPVLDPSRPCVVVAAGTGLGVGLLIPTSRTGGALMVVPSEGGHLQVVNPSDATADELAMLKFISEEKYNGKYTAEYEDLSSGVGMINAYKFLVKNDKARIDAIKNAGDIAKLALSNKDNEAVRTLEIFYEYQILCAQQLAACLQASSVMLLGDNQVYNKAFVEARKDRLRSRFLYHQKSAWLEPVTFLYQGVSMNYNNAGALKIAMEMQPTH